MPGFEKQAAELHCTPVTVWDLLWTVMDTVEPEIQPFLFHTFFFFTHNAT